MCRVDSIYSLRTLDWKGNASCLCRLVLNLDWLQTVAYGYVDVEPGIPKITNKWLEAANYEIGSIGERLAATLHLKVVANCLNM